METPRPRRPQAGYARLFCRSPVSARAFCPAPGPPKGLLNVVNRPILSYIVEEARDAGIEHIVSVTGKSKGAIEDYLDHQIELEAQLQAKGKSDIIQAVTAELGRPGELRFKRQMQPLGLDHAAWCERDIIGDEPFAVLLPDGIVDDAPGALK